MTAAQPGDGTSAARVVDVAELATRAHEIIREVGATGRRIDIAQGGAIVATLSPTHPDASTAADDRRRAMRNWLQETERFAQDVAQQWPSTTSSVESIREQRREL